MKRNIIFVGGVHGVGKTTICNIVRQNIGIQVFSSSELIRKYNSSLLGTDKRVLNVNKNQEILLKAISKYLVNTNDILLDGHFTLISNDNSFENVPEDIFINMGIKKIIVVVDKASVIVQRLKKRDSNDYNEDFIYKFQQNEIYRSKYMANLLGIDLIIYENGTDIDKLIDFINKKD